MSDGPEAQQPWDEGLWSVAKYTWGYKITFEPEKITSASGHGPWTVTLDAPGLSIEDPTGQVAAADGDGTMTWVFPPSRHPLSGVSILLASPWQVRMNLASDRWPMRWFSDALWTLGDGVVVDIVALWMCWRMLRHGRGSRNGRSRDRLRQQDLPIAVIFIALLSVVGYVGYVIDDYYWHNASSDTVWKYENIALVAIAALYFMTALGTRRRWVAVGWILPVAITVVITIFDFPIYLTRDPVSYYFNYSGHIYGLAAENLAIVMIPLLLAVTLGTAGTVLWLSRLWPFGKKKSQGHLRELSATPFSRPRRVVMLVLGMFIVSGLILGQSAAASHYYWLHSNLWDQGTGAFSWLGDDMMNDAHWWIGDGVQWGLGFAVVGGIFALLWAMNADARGVFFDRTRKYLDKPGDGHPRDRGDRILLAALVGSISIGTWGFYDGVSFPLAFCRGVRWSRRMGPYQNTKPTGLEVDSREPRNRYPSRRKQISARIL